MRGSWMRRRVCGSWATWRSATPTSTWPRPLGGACRGIVGLGAIGLEVAKRARGFGMRILYQDHRRRPREERRYGLLHTELDQLLREADFVSLHVPPPGAH